MAAGRTGGTWEHGIGMTWHMGWEPWEMGAEIYHRIARMMTHDGKTLHVGIALHLIARMAMAPWRLGVGDRPVAYFVRSS